MIVSDLGYFVTGTGPVDPVINHIAHPSPVLLKSTPLGSLAVGAK